MAKTQTLGKNAGAYVDSPAVLNADVLHHKCLEH
jgi:hypothetical protein